MSKWPDIPPLTDEEEAAIQRAIADDPDTWELSEEDLRNARPFREVYPELFARMTSGEPIKQGD